MEYSSWSEFYNAFSGLGIFILCVFAIFRIPIAFVCTLGVSITRMRGSLHDYTGKRESLIKILILAIFYFMWFLIYVPEEITGKNWKYSPWFDMKYTTVGDKSLKKK